MPYIIHYRNNSRNWGQHSLGDYCPGLNQIHERILDTFEQGKWFAKKRRYELLKRKGGKKTILLRRGRIIKPYPTKSHYFMDDPRDLAEVKRFAWFCPLWKQKRAHRDDTVNGQQQILDRYFENTDGNLTYNRAKRIYLPHFHMARHVQKEEFCLNMNSWAWEACRMPTKKVGLCCHIFYLNSFDLFDDRGYMDEIGWVGKALPSDLIKFEIHRLLQGFESMNDYFRMYEINPAAMDVHTINTTHQIPSSHHYLEYLKKVGLSRVEMFFKRLVDEARRYGLIRDIIHIWDGQFHETWLQQDKPRKQGLEQFFGGTYNHGGNKVGVGVYQSTIMDWNGYCAIPIHCQVVPANKNENPVLRNTVKAAYSNQNPQPKPFFFLADRGPSGLKTQQEIWDLGMYPIIPLKKNIVKGVIITEKKKHRFYACFVQSGVSNTLEKLYNIRTRIEEHYSLNEIVYRTARLHCCGEIMTKIEIMLINCLGVLIPLTAFKIGRPDLMWSPSLFRSHIIHPERIFSGQFRELEKMRWDDSITANKMRY